MRIVVTNKLEYISSRDAVTIFSPFDDLIKTRLENGSFKVLGAL
jgi:hypothetical protein